jgi:hypothetical protein
MVNPTCTTTFFIALMALSLLCNGPSFAQTIPGSTDLQLNTITTAVPFMMIPGNARQMGMGDLGVVSSDQFVETAFTSNAALLATGRRYVHAETNYTPWLRALVPGMYLLSESVAWGITEHHAVGIHARHFSHGTVTFTDINGQTIGTFNPNEFLVQANYAAHLGKGFSIGTAVKLIYSNLTGGLNVGGVDTRPGLASAVDLGFNYRGLRRFSETLSLGYSTGLGLNSLGSKMAYTNLNEEDFLPMNMQLGVMLNLGVQAGKVRFEHDLGYQVTKLLVPTPPQYLRASNGFADSLDASGNRIIAAGKDPNVSVPAAIFQSFGDAPGGSREEWNEVMHHVGHEFRVVLNDRFSWHLREGFFYEHETKGNRQWVSVGGGFGWMGFRMDVAYLIPLQQRHPLEGTVSVSLTYRARMGKVKKMRFPKMDPYDERLELMEALLDGVPDEKDKE